ncbi:hypothetical protein ABH931_006111 [Streptacidiphilus sp. MAP12-33]|uniref:hypothetical protein n=1 Tax=Streptacidiphilus sp. MAP12-33 TaxID=3156266 RepID=UPI00351589E3
MTGSAIVMALVLVLAVVGRCIWPTHLQTPVIPEQPDRSTGQWLRECNQILAAGTGRHRAPSRWAGGAR